MNNLHIIASKLLKTRPAKILSFCAVILLLLAANLFSQTLEKIVSNVAGRSITGDLGRLALAPAGDKFALTDRFANRIYVLDSDGGLLWTVGDNRAVNRPLAVCFDRDDELLFVNEHSRSVLKVFEKDPNRIDTVVSIDPVVGGDEKIVQLMKRHDSSYIVLGEKSGKIYIFDNNWKNTGIIGEHGQGKGKLISPTQFDIMPSGNIVIADRKNYPVQVFAEDGKFLFFAGWNDPRLERGWEASAMGISRQGIIYVADLTNREFREFDQTGHETGAFPFDAGMMTPVSIIMTIDDKMIVLDENNGIFIYTFS